MDRKKGVLHLWLFMVAADFAAVAGAYYTTMMIRFHSDWGCRFFTRLNQALGIRDTGELAASFETFYQTSAFRIIVLLTVTLCMLYTLRDLYPGLRFLRPRLVGWNILTANVTALALFYAYFYLRRNVFHPRSFFFTLIVLNVFYTIAARASMNCFLQWLRERHGLGRCGAIVLGTGREAEWIVKLLGHVHPHGIHFAGQLAPASSLPFEQALQQAESLLRERNAGMLIAADPGLTVGQIMQLLDLSDRLDISAKVLSPHLEVLVAQARQAADMVQGVPLVHFEAPSLVAGTVAWRRAVSVALAGVFGLALLPLFLALALLIRLSSRGPALFLQERLGVNRKPFRMFKFRTMYDRAEEMLAQVEEFNESGGGLFKIRWDPRITPVGRFLRRFSLDELPQLLNVVRGEMVLVGPRPLPQRDFEGYYEEWHYSRHNGLPGLTCLWQVSGRSNLDFHNMCILDVYYLRNQGWLLDLRILIKTFWVVLFAKGAY